ncbi:MAG: tRNA uridine(34) 5-carboxymethylaminomethyl modification radical SAM/GNAT enzyme Elp3, partial [Anaerolineaceae bacterium]|nr:tRNA uridine(34) 5-carboxymethylaminomethyl modification radical SAM/GNAT enzyme Elp3 [Anaerolineaceae bacterium]
MTSEFKSSPGWQAWNNLRTITPERAAIARQILAEISAGVDVAKATRRYPLPEGGYLPKSVLVAVYKQGVAAGDWADDMAFLARIRMKPVRTLSGVTTVTVLTKP